MIDGRSDEVVMEMTERLVILVMAVATILTALVVLGVAVVRRRRRPVVFKDDPRTRIKLGG